MTPESALAMKRLGCRRVQVLSEAAISQPDLDILGNFPVCQSGPFRILSLGRLIHWKGFELSIRAFARFVGNFPDSEYWVVGDGPQRKELARLISELGIDGRVRLLGSMPRAEALEKLRECHVLAHPSLHDSGGWVCLEAMAAARPVVCLDVGGPAVQVSKETGIKVRVETLEQVVEDLSAAFSQLAANPAARSLMGFAGREHVRRYFTWSSKYEVVHRMVEQSVRKPGVAA
jgi:glycosyltransferase involved in cell wall biosynthesis